MEKKPTDELDSILEQTRLDQIDGYVRDHKQYMADSPKAFYYYMKDVLAEKNIRLKDVYTIADVSESYGSKIISMEKHTKNRDLIIRMCIAGHFSWDQISRALKLYGFNELYAKNERDACLIVAVNNRVYDLYRIDEILKERGLEPLSRYEG